MAATDYPSPQPVPAKPGPSDQEIRDAQLATRKARRRQRGRQSTIYTGGLGDEVSPADTSTATLLGGGRAA